jgi:hypothetical protein
MNDARRPTAILAIAMLVGGCVVGPTPTGSPPPAPVGSAPTPSSSPSLAIAASDSASPSPAATPELTGDWQLASLPDPDAPAGIFTDVVPGPDGFLVAGGGGPVGANPIVLNSFDGQVWSREAITGTFAAPFALLTVGARVFAVGGGQTNRCAHPAALTTWARDISGGWREAPFDNVFCNGPGNSALFEFDRHVVLAGAGVGDQSFYLTSEDGLLWTDTGPNPFGDVYPQSLLAFDQDLWIFGSLPDGTPVVIHRTAGKPFEKPVALPGLGSDASIRAAVWLDGGPLVVVSEGPAIGILRLDGAGSWTSTPASGLPGDQVAGIYLVDGHLVALGGTEAGDPEAWASVDGIDWKPVPLPMDAQHETGLTGVAVLGGTAVLIGQVNAPGGVGAIGAIWTGPARLLAP